VGSVFNKPRNFIYWVIRGVAPLVDFDGKPIPVQGFYSMPKHVFERRDTAPWPRPSGNSVLESEEYVSTKRVTESQMVQMFLDMSTHLTDPYES
jgi:hypothetical protein